MTRILVTQSLEEKVPGREGLKESLGQRQCHLSREVRIQGHSKFPLPRPTLGPLVPTQRPDGLSLAQTPELVLVAQGDGGGMDTTDSGFIQA